MVGSRATRMPTLDPYYGPTSRGSGPPRCTPQRHTCDIYADRTRLSCPPEATSSSTFVDIWEVRRRRLRRNACCVGRLQAFGRRHYSGKESCMRGCEHRSYRLQLAHALSFPLPSTPRLPPRAASRTHRAARAGGATGALPRSRPRAPRRVPAPRTSERARHERGLLRSRLRGTSTLGSPARQGASAFCSRLVCSRVAQTSVRAS
jgi:hypothetical protein